MVNSLSHSLMSGALAPYIGRYDKIVRTLKRSRRPGIAFDFLGDVASRLTFGHSSPNTTAEERVLVSTQNGAWERDEPISRCTDDT